MRKQIIALGILVIVVALFLWYQNTNKDSKSISAPTNLSATVTNALGNGTLSFPFYLFVQKGAGTVTTSSAILAWDTSSDPTFDLYTAEVIPGTQLTFSQTANLNYGFGGWSSIGASTNPCTNGSALDPTCVITVSASTKNTLVAKYNKITVATPVINSFTASKTLISSGESAILSWISKSSAVSSCTLNNVSVPLYNSNYPVSPKSTTIYTLKCLGMNNQSVEKSLTIKVKTSVTPPPVGISVKASDTTPPVLKMLSPQNGTTASGTIVVAIDATDDSGRIEKVVIFRDKTDTYSGDIIATLTTPPYTVTVDAARLTPGPHTFFADAYDYAGNVGHDPNTVLITRPSLTPEGNFRIDFVGIPDRVYTIQKTGSFTQPYVWQNVARKTAAATTGAFFYEERPVGSGFFKAYQSEKVTLSWNPSPDPTVTGYKIYVGTSTRSVAPYQYAIDVGNGTTCVVYDLVPGTTYYFAATAYNVLGMESDFSDEVSYTVPLY